MELVTNSTPRRTWRADLSCIFFTAACAFILVAFSSCSTDGPGPQSTTEPDTSEVPGTSNQSGQPSQTGQPATPGPSSSGTPTYEYVVWGDSTTSGIGASNFSLSYPSQLESLTGRKTFNGGVSGQTSDQIAAREGGAPALLTFPSNILPASGPVVIQSQTTLPITSEGPGPITGSIKGFHGTLTYQPSTASSTEHLVFTRDDSGINETIPPQTPFRPDTFAREAQINVFWMGQNNFYDPRGVISDIAKSVAFLSTDKFIVMSLLNAGDEGIGTSAYDTLAQINNELARTYSDHFLDIRKILVTKHDGTAQDLRDFKNDIPPTSLRNDNEHLNDKGYGIVAQEIANFTAKKAW